MTYFSYTEVLPSANTFWFNFKELLKQAGWTVNSSGTGTGGTYNASGDSWTTVASILTVRPWFVASHPTIDGYQRWICIQLDSSGVSARIKIGWSAFSGGSPSANTVPSSTDEQFIIGTGTDASPTAGSLLVSTVQNNNIMCMVGDASEKFSFYAISYNTATAPSIANVNMIFMMQYLTNTNPLDIDPYVYSAYGNGSPIFSSSASSWESLASNQPFGWYRKGLSSAAFVRYPIIYYGSSGTTNINNSISNNSFDQKMTLLPVIFCRTTGGQRGIKGTAVNISLSPTARASLSTISVNQNQDKIYMGPHIVFNHNGTTPRI